MNPLRSFALALAAVITTAGWANAASIALNFTSDRFPSAGPNIIAPATVVGVVPQANWNNTPSVVSGSMGTLVSNTGGVSGATVSWGATVGTPQEVSLGESGTGNAFLYKDYLETGANVGDGIRVTFSNLSYAAYDIYVYVGDFVNNPTAISSTTLRSSPTYYYANYNNLPFLGFVEATSTTQAGASFANYVHFSNVTGSTFFVDVSKVTGNRGAIAAIQVVSVPEPSTLVLTALSVVVLGGVAWRKSHHRAKQGAMPCCSS